MAVEVVQTEPGTRWRASTNGYAATAFLGRMHRAHAWLDVGDEVPAPVLRELAGALVTELGRPLLAKAVPGTDRHARLVGAGGTAYQVCPPSEVDGTRADNAAWAQQDAADGTQLTDLAGLGRDEVLDLWIRLYTWVHDGWATVEDEGAAREVFGPMLAQALDPGLSVLARRDGTATAVAFAVREPDGPVCVVAEAVDPDAPSAREDVAAVMRAVVRSTAAAGVPMFFDGHVADPHYPQVLATVPHVTGRGLHLLRLGGPDVPC